MRPEKWKCWLDKLKGNAEWEWLETWKYLEIHLFNYSSNIKDEEDGFLLSMQGLFSIFNITLSIDDFLQIFIEYVEMTPEKMRIAVWCMQFIGNLQLVWKIYRKCFLRKWRLNLLRKSHAILILFLLNAVRNYSSLVVFTNYWLFVWTTTANYTNFFKNIALRNSWPNVNPKFNYMQPDH